MKKFVLFLLGVVVFVAAVFVAAPVLAGAAIGSTLLFTGVKLVATAAGIPTWAAVLIFIALIPSALWWCFQILTPKVRRRLVIMLITVGILYALITAALGNQYLVAAAHSAAAAIQKMLFPVKSADPVTEAWFNHDGKPRLSFVRPAPNVWRFYQGANLVGAHDPATGAELETVTPLVREQWQAEQARERAVESAREEQAERLALDAQRRQLASAEDSLRAEKDARLRDQQIFLSQLLGQLEVGQKALAAAVEKKGNPSLQSIIEANGRLDEARTALSIAMTNGSPDLSGLQVLVKIAVSNSVKAQLDIEAASAAQETAALGAVATNAALEAELQQLKDQRRQSELAAQNAAAERERLHAEAQTSNNQSRQQAPITSQGQPVQRQSQNHWRGPSSKNGRYVNVATSTCRWWILGGDGRAYLVSADTLRAWIQMGQLRSGALIAREGDPQWGRLSVSYPRY